MATLYTQSDRNIRLTWIYITGFLVFVIAVGYVFSQAMGSSAILYGAVIFAVFMSIGSYWWSDKIVLSMSGAKEVTRENARENQKPRGRAPWYGRTHGLFPQCELG